MIAMDGTQLSRFPHLSWFGVPQRSSPRASRWTLSFQGTIHVVHLLMHGSYRNRWITQGVEETWRPAAGHIHFVPADDKTHTVLVEQPTPYEWFTLLLPPQHINDFYGDEGLRPCGSLHELRVNDDRVLQSCVMHLSTRNVDDDNQDRHKDEWARRLVLRLRELTGGGTPDWHDDASVFERRTLLHLVAYVDEHLRIAPTLGDMALRVGMSPSHFAKKFRQSTGLSLCRFINRRRIARSLETLKNDASLASIALDLGFSSQSHFTRLFSGLTGMTPAKYRKQVRPVVA